MKLLQSFQIKQSFVRLREVGLESCVSLLCFTGNGRNTGHDKMES